MNNSKLWYKIVIQIGRIRSLERHLGDEGDSAQASPSPALAQPKEGLLPDLPPRTFIHVSYQPPADRLAQVRLTQTRRTSRTHMRQIRGVTSPIHLGGPNSPPCPLGPTPQWRHGWNRCAPMDTGWCIAGATTNQPSKTFMPKTDPPPPSQGEHGIFREPLWQRRKGVGGGRGKRRWR
jgi:hypothetical protein